VGVCDVEDGLINR
jgi:hypothetical protein